MNSVKKWLGFPSSQNPKLWIDSESSFTTAFNLYHPYSKWGQLAKAGCECLPYSMVRFFFSGQPEALTNELLNKRTDYIKKVIQKPDLTINFSTGTPGVHRKTTVQVASSNQVLSYVKIGGKSVEMLLENEAHILRGVKQFKFSTVVFPEILNFSQDGDESYLFQTAPKETGRQRDTEIDNADINFLKALSVCGRQEIAVADFFSEHGYQEKLNVLQSKGNYGDLWKDAKEVIEQQIAGNKICCSFSHGDYAPWNTLSLSNGDLYVFDWEYGREVAPVLTDCMHRIFMPARLVAAKGSYQCVQLLLSVWETKNTKQLVNELNISQEYAVTYILLYLIDIASREHVSEKGVSDFLIACVVTVLRLVEHPKHKKKVLVSAYACEPDEGSEPGVGWHWVEEISREHDTWVITKKNNRESIERQLAALPNANLHFEYVEVPKWASFWKKKQRGVRIYYYLWQFVALLKAKQLNQSVVFDLGHHVTFVNDWLWTFFALMPLPYIWGPVGSNSKLPDQLLLDSKSRKKDLLMVTFKMVMRCIDPLYWVSMFRASKILAINEQTASVFPLGVFAKNKIEVHPAIAVEQFNDLETVKKTGNKFRVLFVGRFIPIKGAHLAIDAFALFAKRQPDCNFTLVGKGTELIWLQQQVKRLGLQDKVEFIDWLPRDQVITLMAQADVFLFPSMEGAGMVVLEAMALGVPVVCLDFGGPAAVIDKSCGFKVEIGSQQATVEALAKALIQLKTDEQLKLQLAEGAIKKVQLEMLWSSKSRFCRQVYSTLNF